MVGKEDAVGRRLVTVVLLAFVLLAGLLISCGGRSENPEAISPATPDASVLDAQGQTTEPSLTAASGSRLETIKERGHVICAGRNDIPGFGYQDSDGRLVGFDTDLCRALAVATIGDPDAIEVRLINAADHGPTIQSGEVDALIRTITTTTSRQVQWGNFGPTMFYDGQGFLVRKSLNLSGPLDLDSAAVCVAQGTTTEANLQDFSQQYNLGIEVLAFEETDAAKDAYEADQCDAYTTDTSALAAFRFGTSNPDDHEILPGTISEEPLGPVVPHGDEQWYDIVILVMTMLIYAEAYGVDSTSVPDSPTGDPKVDRLFGYLDSYGQTDVGLSQTVAQDVIRALGNYGEIYERNLGSGGIGLAREGSRNALWAEAPCTECPKGGQLYAAPPR